MLKQKVAFILLALLFALSGPTIQTAWADDDEREEESEDESEDEENDDRESSDDVSDTGSSDSATKTETAKPKKQKTEYREVTTYKPAIKYVVVTEPGYDSDSDNDALVDALDPDPTIPQREYFTDDDGDSVPNVLDAYRGEDDFAYMEGDVIIQ